MKKFLSGCCIVLMLAGLVCGGVCGVQFVMALRYGELGRVLLYFILAILGIELFAVCLTRLVRGRKKENSVHS